MYTPILLKDVSLCYPNKICFQELTAQILPGTRLALVGRNGSGKSSLLDILRLAIKPTSGEVLLPKEITIGYLEQTIENYQDLSGGQRINQRLTEVLAQQPDLLLLDEPTNHLDLANRKSLIRLLQHYAGTLIIASHDIELIRKCTDQLWQIEDHRIEMFTGSYDDYRAQKQHDHSRVQKELEQVKSQHKATHLQLMKEQKRAAKSRSKGQKSIDQRKWPTVVSHAKVDRAQATSGRKKAAIDQRKQRLQEELADLRLPEVILPTFSLNAAQLTTAPILTIHDASVGYLQAQCVLSKLSFSLSASGRIAIVGKNASGKSTLLKAIQGNSTLYKTGSWSLPKPEEIGYLDQHYTNLMPNETVLEHLRQCRADWTNYQIRQHLKDFLFRKNEEVECLASQLSGGEKVRLSLALIAARTPKLLILDEVTNNLDLETKAHVIQVLKAYPGAMIVVSHEEEFLKAIDLDCWYEIDTMQLSVSTPITHHQLKGHND